MAPYRKFIINETHFKELHAYYTIKSGDGDDPAKTAVMIYEDGSTFMLNVAAIPESHRSKIKEYFVLDNKDLAIVKAVIEKEGADRAVEILKDLKSFYAHHPEKNFYLRGSILTVLDQRFYFCDELNNTAVALSSEPQLSQFRTLAETVKLNPYGMISLEMIAQTLNGSGIDLNRITILYDFVESKSRKLAWSSKEIELIYTYNGAGEKVIRRAQAAFHVFRRVFCGVQWDSEHCYRNPRCMDDMKKSLPDLLVHLIGNNEDSLILYQKVLDDIKKLTSYGCPDRESHENSGKPDFYFSTKNPTDEIPLQEYIDICKFFNISAYPNFLWENGEKKETIPVWVVRVQLAAEWIKNADFSEAIKEKLRSELIYLQPMRGVISVLELFVKPNYSWSHDRMNWFPLNSSPSLSLKLNGDKRNEILRKRKEAKKAGKGTLKKEKLDEKIADEQIRKNERPAIHPQLMEMEVKALGEVEDQFYGLESYRSNYLAITSSGVLKFLDSDYQMTSASADSQLSKNSTSSDPSTSQLPSTEDFTLTYSSNSQDTLSTFEEASVSRLIRNAQNHMAMLRSDDSTEEEKARKAAEETKKTMEYLDRVLCGNRIPKSSESVTATAPIVPKPTSATIPKTSSSSKTSKSQKSTSSKKRGVPKTKVSDPTSSMENLSVTSSENLDVKFSESMSSEEPISTQNQNPEASSETLKTSTTSSETPITFRNQTSEPLTSSEEVQKSTPTYSKDQQKIVLKESEKRTNDALAALKSTQDELFRIQNLLEKSEKNEEIMRGRWKEEEKNLINEKKSYEKLEKGLRSEMDTMRNEIKQLKSEKAQLINTEEALEDARAECKLLTQKNKNLKEQLKKSSNTKELSKAKEELEARTDFNTKLDFTNMRLQKANDKLTEENAQLKREIDEFKKLRKSDEMEIQRLTSNISHLNNQPDYTEMIQKTAKLEEDLKTLKKSQQEQANVFQLVAPTTSRAVIPTQATPTFLTHGTTVAPPRCFVCQKLIEKNQESSKCGSCGKEIHGECAQRLQNNGGTCWCCGKRM